MFDRRFWLGFLVGLLGAPFLWDGTTVYVPQMVLFGFSAYFGFSGAGPGPALAPAR